ncbi:MAG: hypothetical protein EZS28_054285, partial [Streblomastix strix]
MLNAINIYFRDTSVVIGLSDYELCAFVLICQFGPNSAYTVFPRRYDPFAKFNAPQACPRSINSTVAINVLLSDKLSYFIVIFQGWKLSKNIVIFIVFISLLKFL